MKRLTFILIFTPVIICRPKRQAQCVTAGPDQSICQGGATDILRGSLGGDVTSAVWTSDAGGTFTNNGGGTPDIANLVTNRLEFTGTATLTLTAIGWNMFPIDCDPKK